MCEHKIFLLASLVIHCKILFQFHLSAPSHLHTSIHGCRINIPFFPFETICRFSWHLAFAALFNSFITSKLASSHIIFLSSPFCFFCTTLLCSLNPLPSNNLPFENLVTIYRRRSSTCVQKLYYTTGKHDIFNPGLNHWHWCLPTWWWALNIKVPCSCLWPCGGIILLVVRYQPPAHLSYRKHSYLPLPDGHHSWSSFVFARASLRFIPKVYWATLSMTCYWSVWWSLYPPSAQKRFCSSWKGVNKLPLLLDTLYQSALLIPIDLRSLEDLQCHTITQMCPCWPGWLLSTKEKAIDV